MNISFFNWDDEDPDDGDPMPEDNKRPELRDYPRLAKGFEFDLEGMD